MTSVNSTNFVSAMGAGSGIDTKSLAENLASAEVTLSLIHISEPTRH